ASTGNNDARSSGGESQTRSDDSWSAFWNKVAKGEAAPDRSHEFASVVDRGQVEARAAATAERATQAFHRDGSLQRETMRNLEQAFMKNLGQGHRQLTLRLDPPQLGRVAILLTVKNNEVSATLRTERHETGQMLAEQLQQLRHSLEQQGLRVQKLDVQTQMNNDANQQSWLGMDNHNAARDQDARQQTLKAWKQMRGASRSESTLAHDVHNGNVQEQISQGGLHLIA
ncbi:MAG: flagellar hook-length control protein FliK, partial [Oceanidesulfovibrio sp.]